MISKYILLFTLCSVVGWVYESIYALIVTGKWENRGFLYGPLCPIYGFGVVGIVVIAKAYLIYAHAAYTWWQIAIVAFFGSMLLEYAVSWALEQLFHAYWWDYADMPLNINGRTCVPAGILFSLGGVGAVEIVSPWWDSLMAPVPLNAIEAAAFIIVFVIAADATLTVAELTEIQERVALASEVFHSRADELTSELKTNTVAAAETIADKTTAAAGTIADKTTAAAETVASKLAEQRDYLQEEVLRTAFDNMSGAARMTLSRVEGFRLPQNISAPDVPAFTKNLLERARVAARAKGQKK